MSAQAPAAAAAAEPVRFGIQGSGQHTEGLPDPGLFRAVADLAEELGWDSIWGGEHLSFHNPILDLSVALSIFAARTTRVQLGAGLVLLPLRHPSWVAKTYGSLDFASAGRVLLGIGIGGEGEKDFEAAGVPIRERGARADEAVSALRALWHPTAQPAAHAGRFYAFEGVRIDPPLAQPGGPPLLVGGRSEAALRRAGRLGDGWLAYMVSADRFARDMATVRAHAEAAGRGAAALTPAIVLPAHVGPDGEGDATRERTRAHLSERYATRFEPHHVARYTIAGDAAECRARLREYVDAGVRHFVLNPAGPAAGYLGEVEALHEQVVRPLRAELAAAGIPVAEPVSQSPR